MLDLPQQFHTYKGKKIAIYGLGTETEKILEELKAEFQIIGLLDSFKETGWLYGFPIISINQAVKSGITLILIVARPGSCRAIARRIGETCKKYQIALFDIRGIDLCEKKKIIYHLNDISGSTKKEVLQKILAYDIVSFDLFDTLIMRQTLFSTDIFEMVDVRLRQHGIGIEDFSKKREASEKELSKQYAPDLKDIYCYMKETYHLSDLVPEMAADLEWQIDYNLIIPRKEVCELLSKIYKCGKEIVILSDSYYTRQQIIKILKKCGISNIDNLFISCEYGTGKTQMLFQKWIDMSGDALKIHIGDDIVADIESAKRNGIDTCHLYSGLDLLEQTGYMGLWEHVNSLSDRIKVGMAISLIFNSPFQFEEKENMIQIMSAYQAGYLFFAPIISDFVFWFHRQIKEKKIANILFCARDGYFIKKLYDKLEEDSSSIYFLISRIAAIRAGVADTEDLKYVEEMKYSGTLKEQVKERFGIVSLTEKKELKDYAQEIFDRATRVKKAYQAYIKKLDIKEGDIAFFDFVAKGTSQFYVSRLLDQHLKGFYFLWLDKENMKQKGLDIESFYQSEEIEKSVIYEDYYILETILTSPEASVLEFKEDGIPIYAQETRTEEEICCFQQIQAGILEYFQIYLNICPIIEINKELDECLLSLIHKIKIQDKEFWKLRVEDKFFNRMTEVSDLI